MAWPKVQFNGVEYYQAEGVNLIPVDGTGTAIVMLKEDGGITSGVTAVAQGDPGVHAEIDTTINFVALEPGDATPDSASFTTLVPPTTDTPGVWRLNLALHKGAPGDPGDTVLDPGDFGTAVAGQILQVKSDLSAFELVAQRIPEVFYPGVVNNVASGNANFTMAQINIPARPYARRVQGVGHAVVTGEAADVRVDLIARLNGETGGNIVGRCPGIAQTERLQLSPGRGAGLADAYDQIAPGAAAVLYIRTERQAGTSTYTASASVAQFEALVLPL
ncbi:hypothetical protein [Mycolicibacterium fortuitum]|uniref:Minor tail protein n=1 Tax=Mycolicibacterium fortuitum TaxID=1766 RepID=A0AAE4V6S9_MYCFO|nr:hypothetical protein [Mycolicibacterium fortuitum]MDV7194601.1 hypothetical protein [Mycolicibacterium fortuitum]MDV7203577.1 hypothetical protein [Mycolicibacterium fortuitum]MDV7228742.1 hypothetical protein [Mycolicibacterium fortuitum]MDV7261895.1 hypothetical protein [Mycolicibacterium fortuitum]MDV7286996.1 hypothetical protein [Mycolicibacterium fortuitum]